MLRLRKWVSGNPGYVAAACCALICAIVLAFRSDVPSLPVIGDRPLFPIVLAAALAGVPLLLILRQRQIGGSAGLPKTPWALAGFVLLGAILALLPVLIDLARNFPRSMNAPLPEALFFYPAIALVAEVVFHLFPLAVLTRVMPRATPPVWILAPVVFVEPAFQAADGFGSGWVGFAVFANVSLISAIQLWAFARYGFGAMIAVRLSFYAFWHIGWGAVRLHLLF